MYQCSVYTIIKKNMNIQLLFILREKENQNRKASLETTRVL